METSTKDAINNTNNVLQSYEEVQKLCETIKTKRNYPKRSIHNVITTTDSFIPSKRVRSVETIMDNTENTPPKNNEPTPPEQSSPITTTTTTIPLKLSLDRDAFYKRLETYSTLFVSKRRPVNALQCAMHGFIDTHVAGGAKENICKLSCSTCDCTNFVIDISCFNPNIPKVQEIMQTYLEDLSKSHRAGCFWKFDKCADVIYAFPYSTSTEALDLIKTEGTRLLGCNSLPTIDHPLTTEQCEKLDVIIGTFENNNQQTLLSSESKRIPYIIAMFGWRLHDNKGSLKCHHCFQTIQNSSSSSSSPSPFHLISNHMEYCSWINRKQAMIQRMNEEGIEVGGHTEDNMICGYEWMMNMMDLEYDFLFYMRESSAEYQEARLQWFRNTRRRMVESRTALAMEFPDSPESIPELTKDMGDEEEDQIIVEKEEDNQQQQRNEEKVVTNEEIAISDKQLPEEKEQPVGKEPSMIENEDETQVQPTETSELESTNEKEEESSSKPSQEIEDELMDYMESEPEDEGEAEPTTTDVTTTEAATTTTTAEGEEKIEETTTDIDIDVSLLEDVQTPITGVSTPLPDQLQQDHLDEEVQEANEIIVTTPSGTKEPLLTTSPPTSTIATAEDVAVTTTISTPTDIEASDKAQESLIISGGEEQQEQQPDDTSTIALTPSAQIEETVDDGDEVMNGENMNQVPEESSTAPVISMEESVELVSSSSSSSPTIVDGQEKEHQLISTTSEEKEKEEEHHLVPEQQETGDSVLINEEENTKDIQLQLQEEEDQTKSEEQEQAEMSDQFKENKQEEENTNIDLMTEQQQQDEEVDKDMEVLEQTVPQIGHDVAEDAVVVTNLEDEKEEEGQIQEIQGTVSVSPKLEQENGPTNNDKENEGQTPTSDSLEGLEEEDALEQSQQSISNGNIPSTEESDDFIQATEQEGEITEPQEGQVGNNDESKATTTIAVDEEIATKEKEKEEETVEEIEETADGVIISETTIVSSTGEASNNSNNGGEEGEKEADNAVAPTTTLEIVELDESNKEDSSEAPIISIDNNHDGVPTAATESVNEVKEQSDIIESTDGSAESRSTEMNASENVVVEKQQSEEEPEPLKGNSFDTPVSNQAGSTPQFLQSIEEAFGQSPAHPDNMTTTTIANDDTQQNIDVSEPAAQTSVAAAAVEEETSTVVTSSDDNMSKKNLEDPMMEDGQEVNVSNSLINAATEENTNSSNHDISENTTGVQGHEDVEQGGEKEVNVGSGESGNGTAGEAMDEDNNDEGGDVNMREIVDEEMENVEEEKGEAME